jgi:hypothetical protein
MIRAETENMHRAIPWLILFAACSPGEEPAPPREPAPAQDTAFVSLPPEQYDQMARWDFPLGEAASACVPLDSVPVADEETRLTRPLRDGERFRCVMGTAADLVLQIRVEMLDSANSSVRGLRVHAESGEYDVETTWSEPPPRGFPFLATHDLDFDGIRELKLLVWWGATGNTGWEVFRMDRGTGRLVLDSALTALSDPEPLAGAPCLRTGGVGGAAGAIHSLDVYCWAGRRLIHAYAADQADAGGGLFIRRGFALRPGADTLVLFRVDSVRDTLWR